MQPSTTPSLAADPAWRSKHQAILDAAHDLFTTRGYGGTTMRDLALAAGCSVGYLYKHFPGKQDILDALCAEHLDVFEGIRTACRRGGAAPVLDCVADELDQLCRHLADHRSLIPVYTQRETETAPWLRERLEELRRQDVALFTAAVARGELPALDATLLAAALDGAVWGLLKTLAPDDGTDAFLAIPRFIDGLILAPLRRRAAWPQEGGPQP